MSNGAIKLILFICFLSFSAFAQWERNVEVSEARSNIFKLSKEELHTTVMKGRRHALLYPVGITELLIPYAPMKTFFETEKTDPVRKLLYNLAKIVSPFKSIDEVFSWLGLHDYPLQAQAETPNPLPMLTDQEKKLPLGATILQTEGGEGLTFSCASCHAGALFGVKVLGLTNRFPRASQLFAEGKKLTPYVNSFLFQDLLKATDGERQMFVTTKEAMSFVGSKTPVILGLDTSLAQVALSLARRGEDPHATRQPKIAKRPRKNKLETMIADSKPAVWWNVKYKNRWLSDGSVVSGNPVHTNLLWNEIGRGADLQALEEWMKENDHTIQELTAAVFATQAPRYEKFFGLNSININKAKRGQVHYMTSCARCHGVYEKGWEKPDADRRSQTELIQNVKLTYHKLTPVRDVGTDPGRYLGMQELAGDLNRLQIQQNFGTVIEPQKGYVPPPLDGIWSRWPYFHNNSIPNLCALLTPSKLRPTKYYAGPAINKATDFDQECVGYPIGAKTPAAWKKPEYLYDTNIEGLSNQGHDDRIFIKEGKEIMTPEEKLELIEFLKTL